MDKAHLVRRQLDADTFEFMCGRISGIEQGNDVPARAAKCDACAQAAAWETDRRPVKRPKRRRR